MSNKKNKGRKKKQRKRIADNPSIKNIVEPIEGFHNLLKFQEFAPIFGSIFPDLNEHASKIKELHIQVQELASIPDNFNDLFSKRGWIASEFMSVDWMREAIKIANEKSVNDAEVVLADHYDEVFLKFLFYRISWRDVFDKRMRLIELAREDYLAERYHACIPLLLALIDGIVQDLSKHVGFFAEQSDVTAWDSIAGHESGLQFIAEIFKQTRKKTNEEPITIPFRNGILHGKELAFDNKIVAAKCWATLSAIRDWIHSVENPKEMKKEKTFEEILNDLKEHTKKQDEFKKMFNEYMPRDGDRSEFCVSTR